LYSGGRYFMSCVRGRTARPTCNPPLPLMPVAKKCPDSPTVIAHACQRIGPGPVARGFERQSNAPPQVVERRLAESADSRPRGTLGLTSKGESCRNQKVVGLVCLWPRQQMLQSA